MHMDKLFKKSNVSVTLQLMKNKSWQCQFFKAVILVFLPLHFYNRFVSFQRMSAFQSSSVTHVSSVICSTEGDYPGHVVNPIWYLTSAGPWYEL